MEFGICHLSLVPGRAEPDDRSEMVTQLLFGDLLVSLETFKNWQKVRLIADNYETWIDKKQFMSLSEEEFREINDLPLSLSADLVEVLRNKTDQHHIPILLGSNLPGITEGVFKLAGKDYQYDGQLARMKESREKLVENALLYLNAPYLWGGKSPFGIDCSGLTQMVYKLCGFSLLRDAGEQATQGESISFISEAKPGDLLFFDNEEGEIIHVGILLNESKIIHASGQVRIDHVDHQGIYHADLKRYTHKMRLIKRFF